MPLQKPANDDRPNVSDKASSTPSVVKNSDQNSSCNSGTSTQISGVPVSATSTAITASSNWSTNYVCVKHVVQDQSANTVRTAPSAVLDQSSGKNVPAKNISEEPELQKDNFPSDNSGATYGSSPQTVPPECFCDSRYAVQSSALLRNGTQKSPSRKPSRIVSFTTEDFDLFQRSKFRSPTAAASAAVKPITGVPTSGSEQRDQLALRQRSHSVGSMLCSTHNDVITGGITCVPEEVVTPDVPSESKMVSLCEAEGSERAVSARRHSSMKSCLLSQGGTRNTAQLHTNDTEPRLTRRATARHARLSRRSTRRVRQIIPDINITEFDDDNDAEAEEGEGVEFSETDSEDKDDDDLAGISGESDLEFETELAKRMTVDQLQKPRSQVQKIAAEIVETEKKYVDKLHLVDQVFHFKVVLANREHHMFPDEVVTRIFSNIKSIYQFHHDFLLPQLQSKMEEQCEDPHLGDVMRKFAPFLKLYSEYVKNFDGAMEAMSYWLDKSPRFQQIVNDIQKMPDCGGLNLQHHMLEPIQRVPRYELLLKDYLKHLPDESDDRQNVEKALQLVMTAAGHSNEAMRKIEQFRKLVNINESLHGEFDIISPTRELIKEGKIKRISARDGDIMDRYVFLFNDVLLLCKSLPLNIGQHQQYHVKSVLEVDGMELMEGDNFETPNTFYVKGKQKSLELHTVSPEEKLDWQVTLLTVIAEFNHKKKSRNLHVKMDGGTLGRRAPVWVKDQETSMCMICSLLFSVIRRRHHCRACGRVICGKCSAKRAPLAYLEDRKERVCMECYAKIRPKSPTVCDVPESPTAVDKQQRRKAPLVLQVKASDPSVICGYLSMSSNARNWQRRWFAVHKDFVLYSFKAHQDVVALTSLPLPGYQVSALTDSDVEKPDCTFKVFHAKHSKVYYFQTDDKLVRNRWVEVLQMVAQLELPEPMTPLPMSPVTPGIHAFSTDPSVT